MRFNVAGLNAGQVNRNHVRRSDGSWLTFGRDMLSLFVRLVLDFVVLFNAPKEIVPTGRLAQMFRPDVQAFLDLPVADDLVDDNTNGARIDVENFGGTTVVDLMRHAFVHGTVNFDINVLSALESGQIVRHPDGTVQAEGLAEFLASAGSVSLGMCHTL